jgi:hypothetical protein
MTREEIILSHIRRDGKGLEIGAGHAPIASKRDGFRVQIPTSFRLMMRDLFDLGLIQLKELAFYPTQGCQCYIVLSRTGTLPVGTRMGIAAANSP